MTDKVESDRLWAMACHLSALLGYCVPLGNIIAPLVIWLAKRDQSLYINEQGKEALNFQITMTIAFCVALVLMIVVIGIFLLPIIALINLVLIIVAAISTYKGQPFRYPFCLRFVK
jgi:uncharacterized Tic20 family protein